MSTYNCPFSVIINLGIYLVQIRQIRQIRMQKKAVNQQNNKA
jgi:hypothetical protein